MTQSSDLQRPKKGYTKVNSYYKAVDVFKQ